MRCTNVDQCASGAPARCGVVEQCSPTRDFYEPPSWHVFDDCSEYEPVFGATVCMGTDVKFCGDPATGRPRTLAR
jgi:hypothetical protein